MVQQGDRFDFEILDGEPWNEANQPVDQLIILQRQAFRADRAGDYRQFGTVLMAMSQVEHTIENHSEAAAHASEAAEAFEKAGSAAEATAAHTTVAREYRTLYNPDLAIASLQEVIAFAGNKPSDLTTETDSVYLDTKALPTIKLVANFVSTFSGVIFEDRQCRAGYPPIVFDKYPKPSRSAAVDLLFSLNQFLYMPLDMTGREGYKVPSYLSAVYSLMSYRRFGLTGMNKTQAKFMATALGRLSFSLGLRPYSANAATLLGGKETINTLIAPRSLSDCLFF